MAKHGDGKPRAPAPVTGPRFRDTLVERFDNEPALASSPILGDAAIREKYDTPAQRVV